PPHSGVSLSTMDVLPFQLLAGVGEARPDAVLGRMASGRGWLADDAQVSDGALHPAFFAVFDVAGVQHDCLVANVDVSRGDLPPIPIGSEYDLSLGDFLDGHLPSHWLSFLDCCSAVVFGVV